MPPLRPTCRLPGASILEPLPVSRALAQLQDNITRLRPPQPGLPLVMTQQQAAGSTVYNASPLIPFPHAITGILMSSAVNGGTGLFPSVAHDIRASREPLANATTWAAADPILSPISETSELWCTLHAQWLGLPLVPVPAQSRYIVRSRQPTTIVINWTLVLLITPLEIPPF